MPGRYPTIPAFTAPQPFRPQAGRSLTGVEERRSIMSGHTTDHVFRLPPSFAGDPRRAERPAQGLGVAVLLSLPLWAAIGAAMWALL